MPLLQFEDVAFRIAHIDERESPCTGDVEGHELAVIPAAPLEDFGALGLHVRHLEGQMREARALDRRRERWVVVGVLKNLERRAPFAVAGQEEMASPGVAA